MSLTSASSGRAPAAAAGISLERSSFVRPAAADMPSLTPHGGAQARPGQSAEVAILLCTFNGARFLPAQLASFEAQDFPDWRLYVSDDGSRDDTLALLTAFESKHGAGRVQIRRGPGRGSVANFLSLICDPALQAEYYALSDQDDVWAPNKLSRARLFLMSVGVGTPGVYCSRARMIDEEGGEIGLTPLFKTPPHFRNALVQNIAIGNTTVFNDKTRCLLMQAGPDVDAAVHDWWIYLLTTAVGGMIWYDPYPSVDYRIHSRNQIGTNISRVRSGWMLLNRFKAWNDSNMRALERIESVMLPENKKTFELFRRSRRRSLLPRLYGLLSSGVYRERVRDNFGLVWAALVGQI
jgi:glycosyltransferase involved in cell wall biosynthesis